MEPSLVCSHIESTCVCARASAGSVSGPVAHPLCCCRALSRGVFGTFWLLESVQLSLVEDKSEQGMRTPFCPHGHQRSETHILVPARCAGCESRPYTGL